MERLDRYLTHPQVEINPAIPAATVGLSALGRRRVAALPATGRLPGATAIVSSGERTAIETAEIPGRGARTHRDIRQAMHEKDHSATGFLPPEEFATVANALFC